MQVYSNRKYIICNWIIQIRKINRCIHETKIFLECAQVQQLLLPIQQLTEQ